MSPLPLLLRVCPPNAFARAPVHAQLPAADIRNTGFVPASYIVSVTECSSGVLPIVVRMLHSLPACLLCGGALLGR